MDGIYSQCVASVKSICLIWENPETLKLSSSNHDKNHRKTLYTFISHWKKLLTWINDYFPVNQTSKELASLVAPEDLFLRTWKKIRKSLPLRLKLPAQPLCSIVHFRWVKHHFLSQKCKLFTVVLKNLDWSCWPRYLCN